MLTEEQLEILSGILAPYFNQLEQDVITDVARRIKKTMTYTRTAELQALSMKELGYSPARIRTEAMKMLRADADYRKAVAKNTMEYKREVKQRIRDTVNKAMHEQNEVLIAGGNMAWIDDLAVWKEATGEVLKDSFLPKLTHQFSMLSEEYMRNLTRTMGFRGINGYTVIENLYTDRLNLALIKQLSGSFNADTTINQIVRDLAKSGLRSIDFASNWSMELDTAVRLALRTSLHQLGGAVENENIKQTKTDYVYVSAHWGARNTGVGCANHEEWQGKVYYVNEAAPSDARKEANRINQSEIKNIYDVTGYDVLGKHANNPLGLYGYNCRHSHYPWFSRISELPEVTPEPKPIEYHDRTYDYYAQTQRQRALERQIRALKREKEACVTLGLDYKPINNKIKVMTDKYNDWCKLCGLNPQPARLRYEFGTSNIAKTQAYKEYIAAKKAVDIK